MKSNESLNTKDMNVRETDNSINDSKSIHLMRAQGQGLRDDVNLDVSDDNISMSNAGQQTFERAATFDLAYGGPVPFHATRASMGGMLFAA